MDTIPVWKFYKAKETDNLDILTLWTMTLDWYAHMLLDLISRLTEAMQYIQFAYDMCIQLNGEIHKQSLVLLNHLGIVLLTSFYERKLWWGYRVVDYKAYRIGT